MTATPILVTGAAGFIGYHTCRKLLEQGRAVLGVDSLTPYYDVNLKRARLAELEPFEHFRFVPVDLADEAATEALFAEMKPREVIHLAAQPGVRAALTEPHPYIKSNVTGFLNVLEGCRHTRVRHLVYASSSSVYGLNTSFPFSEHTPANHPISLYAATKKAGEMMAHAYADLFAIPITGLRFFTVYGPWGRPDMAVYQFTDKIARGEPIMVAEDKDGRDIMRDFTYIDDIVEGIVRILAHPPVANPDFDTDHPDPCLSRAPFCLFNIGNDRPEKLEDLITLIETELGRTAIRQSMPLPLGDVLETRADITDLKNAVGFAPSTPLHEGVKRFVAWYREYTRHPINFVTPGENSKNSRVGDT